MDAQVLPGARYLQNPLAFFIDGKWEKPSSDAIFEVISPASEEKFLQVAAALEPDIDRAVAAARQAFDYGPWPRLSHAERAGYLTAMADALDKRVPDLAAIWPNEMGILHNYASAFAGGISSVYRMYAEMAGSFAFEQELPTTSGAKVGRLVHESVGVVGAIIPWNAPAMLIATKIAPALLAGCTVVLKASPEAPGQALIMAEIAEAIGLPKGVLNVLTADRGPSERLVSNPDVDKITFTGSTATGKAIAAILGGRMARYTMELGGKSAAVILDDYDIETAANTLAETNRLMTGQFCVALSRVIVSKHRHAEMVDALAGAYGRIKTGDPFDAASEMGPLAFARQRDRVEHYFAAAKKDGYKAATGGQRPPHLNRGYYIEPTVFGNVSNKSVIAREEVFGPVTVVIPAEDEADAVAIANDTDFGLAGAVFTNDATRALAVCRQVRTGTISQNALRSDLSIGFGGFKQSGIGREGGVPGLLPYLESKTILTEG